MSDDQEDLSLKFQKQFDDQYSSYWQRRAQSARLFTLVINTSNIAYSVDLIFNGPSQGADVPSTPLEIRYAIGYTFCAVVCYLAIGWTYYKP